MERCSVLKITSSHLDPISLSKKLFLYLLSLVILSILLFASFISVNLFIVDLLHFPSILGYLIFAIVIAFLYEPIKATLQKRINNFFYSADINLRNSLALLSQELLALPSHVSIYQYAIENIIGILLIKKAAFYKLHDLNPNLFICKFGTSKAQDHVFSPSDPFLQPLVEHHKVFCKKDVSTAVDFSIKGFNALKDFFEQELYEVIVPFYSGEKLEGFLLLGEKMSGEEYSYDELQILTHIAYNIESAMDNKKIFISFQHNRNALEELIEPLSFAVALVDNKRNVLIENSMLKFILGDYYTRKDEYINRILDSSEDVLFGGNDYIACTKIPFCNPNGNDGFIVVFTRVLKENKKKFDKKSFRQRADFSIRTTLKYFWEKAEKPKKEESIDPELLKAEKAHKNIVHFAQMSKKHLVEHETTINCLDLLQKLIDNNYNNAVDLDTNNLKKISVHGDPARLQEAFQLILDHFSVGENSGLKISLEKNIDYYYISFQGPSGKLSTKELKKLSNFHALMSDFKKKAKDISKLQTDYAYINEVMKAHKGQVRLEPQKRSTQKITLAFPVAY